MYLVAEIVVLSSLRASPAKKDWRSCWRSWTAWAWSRKTSLLDWWDAHHIKLQPASCINFLVFTSYCWLNSTSWTPTPQGTSSDVPIYLRYEGQLKNLRLKKTDVVRVIKDIWREKASEDEKVASINSVPVGIKKNIWSINGGIYVCADYVFSKYRWMKAVI